MWPTTWNLRDWTAGTLDELFRLSLQADLRQSRDVAAAAAAFTAASAAKAAGATTTGFTATCAAAASFASACAATAGLATTRAATAAARVNGHDALSAARAAAGCAHAKRLSFDFAAAEHGVAHTR